jgi:uncharacterized RDD family membrane protein YckC
MKCPKCGYLGFETVDRCRNCGYDFSLTSAPSVPELPLRAETSPWPEPGDLPLFVPADDRPLISRVPPPRAPLAVRRATPELPRRRIDQPRTPMLDLGMSPVAADPSIPAAVSRGEPAVDATPPRQPPQGEPAAFAARMAAALLDLAILSVVDAAVIYFTLQICGLTLSEAAMLPIGPLIAFLIVQNGSYLVAFTAGGQTLGKMVAGIRVVPEGADGSPDLGRALIRTVVWVALAIPAGVGFLTALGSRDRRGLHDRFAGTRVIRASA